MVTSLLNSPDRVNNALVKHAENQINWRMAQRQNTIVYRISKCFITKLTNMLSNSLIQKTLQCFASLYKES
jgi:hypothetical protein